MNDFAVRLVSSASTNIFLQDTLSSFKMIFNEEINLEGDWRVALSEIIFPAKVNQVNKSDLKIFFLLKALVSLRKVFHSMLSLDHTYENELVMELVPVKTVNIYQDP